MTMRSAPVAVDLPGRAVAIAAGGAHSLALLADGTVYAWGFNGDGELPVRSPSPATGRTPLRSSAATNSATPRRRRRSRSRLTHWPR